MDADRNIIPIVEGDQGEGFMDEIDPMEYLEQTGEKTDYEKLTKIAAEVKLPEKPKRQPHPPMLMQVGMSIHFYGFEYKVIKLMKRGRLVLKLMGRLPDEAKG